MKKQSRWMRIFSCFFTPKDEKKLLQQVLDNETVCLPQFGDNLGERMKNAIGIVLRMGYEKVILIGTDIPQIHPETLKNAFDNLGGKRYCDSSYI